MSESAGDNCNKALTMVCLKWKDISHHSGNSSPRFSKGGK